MEIKINGIYKKRFGGVFFIKVIKITNKMVEYIVNNAIPSTQSYRISKMNFEKYYTESL